ncbi:hypothetical protein ACN28E_51845 [Archangium lansingense]|uniref:hypothetical protein n=1 Tax=Archangium lansingense TaxID=2995310 RepID=UPI003B7FE7E7
MEAEPSGGLWGFLDAVDQVLNSNTLLLRVPFEVGPGPTGLVEGLERYFRSPSFREDFASEMVAREWWFPGRLEERWGPQARLLVEPCALRVRALTRLEVVERLVWMLTAEECSWYRKQLPLEQALPLVDSFLGDVFGAGTDESVPRELSLKTLVRRIPPDSILAGVEPDFLFSTGYFAGDENPLPAEAVAYFEGSKSDGCLVLHWAGTAWLLLTNGSP